MQRQFEKFYEDDWDACAPVEEAVGPAAAPVAAARDEDVPPWEDVATKSELERPSPCAPPPCERQTPSSAQLSREEAESLVANSPADETGVEGGAREAANEEPTRPHTAPRPQRAFGVPALMCRSALFAVGEGAENQSETERPIASYPMYEIKLTGPRLTMRDKAVWEQFAKEAWKRDLLGEVIPISLGRIQRAITGSKWNASKSERAAIAERLKRLARCKVAYSMTKAGDEMERTVLATGEAWLIADLTRHEATESGGESWTARLDPAWAALFAVDTLCPLRPSLAKHRPTDLALWLRDFLGSNKAYEYDLPRLRALSGFEATADKFPSRLRAAMVFLAERCPKVVASWKLDNSERSANDWKLASEPAKDPEVKVSKAVAKKAAPKRAKESAKPVETKKTPKRSGGVVL